MAFMALMASSVCFGDITGVADTSKEGSLLIWPLIQTNDGNETYIVITNSTGGGNAEEDRLVNIKCYWEVRDVTVEPEGNACPLNDLVFNLSVTNPLIFKASNGENLLGKKVIAGAIGTGMKGMLKCWAVNPSERAQIAWNHLSAYAIIVKEEPTPPSGLESAWKYSAWRFAANLTSDENGTEPLEGFWVGRSESAGANHNELHLYGAWTVAVSSSFPKPPACSQGSQPDGTCCPTGTIGILMKRSDTAPDYQYSYLCIQRVAPGDLRNCQWPYDDDNVTRCKKVKGVYDACPQYLTFDFLAEPSSEEATDGYAINYLALAPCREDLRDDENGPGKVDTATRLVFTIYNQNEDKRTGTYSCPHCSGPRGSTYDIYLSELSVGKKNFFQEFYLGTPSGRFRVEGLAGKNCPGGVKTPLVGVMASKLLDSDDLVGTVGTGAGGPLDTFKYGVDSNPVKIKWNRAEEVLEKAKRKAKR